MDILLNFGKKIGTQELKAGQKLSKAQPLATISTKPLYHLSNTRPGAKVEAQNLLDLVHFVA